jgi:hypothetical protein
MIAPAGKRVGLGLEGYLMTLSKIWFALTVSAAVVGCSKKDDGSSAKPATTPPAEVAKPAPSADTTPPPPAAKPVAAAAETVEFEAVAKELWAAKKEDRSKVFDDNYSGKLVHGKGKVLQVKEIMGDKTFTMDTVEHMDAVVTIAKSEVDKYAKLKVGDPVEWTGKVSFFSDHTDIKLGLGVQAKDATLQ